MTKINNSKQYKTDANHIQNNREKEEQRQHQLALMLIVVVVVFMLCNILAIMNNILEAFQVSNCH